jgi:5'-deoxynucleotidase YfbR-like HD superfamily hydrolase
MTDFAEITGSADPLISAYRSLDVKRYHTQGDVPGQSLADHSGRVALLIMMIWPEARPQVTQYALVHDIGEKSTGDMPYTTKLVMPPAAMDAVDTLEAEFVHDFLGIHIEITEDEKMMVKVCDYLELMLYCLQFNTRGAAQIAKKGAELIYRYGSKLRPDHRGILTEKLRSTFLTDILHQNVQIGSELNVSLEKLRLIDC